MPNETVLDNLKRLMAEYDASREGEKPFGHNIFPFVRALMNAAHSLIAAAESLQEMVDEAEFQDPFQDEAYAILERGRAALAPLTKEE
jgi:hypothetical protein